MAADERLTRPRERRYAVMSKDTVRVYAESVGLTELTDEMAEALAEDVSYRLRDVIQQSYELMHHCKRRKMTADDFNAALKNSDVQPIFGHSCRTEPVNFQQTEDGEIFFQEDREIDLASLVSAEIPTAKPGPTTIKASWVAIEGVETDSPGQQSSSQANANRAMTSVSEDLLLYYDIVTKAILGSDIALMKEALSNLSSNTKIAPLLSYLVNFVSNGVKTVSHDSSQLRRLLYTINALVINPSLNLHTKPYLSMLVQTICYCLLEPLAASISPTGNHWALRDYAATLLAVLTSRWNTLMNKLREQNIKMLGSALADSSRPVCSHYGALVGLRALGLDALSETLLPLLPEFVPRLSSVLADNSSANVVARHDAQHVLGALLTCAISLVQSEASPTDDAHSTAPLSDPPPVNVIDVDKPTTSAASAGTPSTPAPKFSATTYALLYESLGDSLSVHLPLVSVPLFAAYRKVCETAPVLDVDATAGQSGEELLRQFLNPLPTAVDRSSRSSERSSPMSSDGGPTVDADMAIKETVSDPSFGIRLTILKRPKLRPESAETAQPWPPVEQSKSKEPGKPGAPVKKLSSTLSKGVAPRTKLSLEEAFDDFVVRRKPNSDVVFVFRFQGRTQQCIAPATLRLLPRWGIGGRSTVSWYQVLCRRLPHVGPIRRRLQAPESRGTEAMHRRSSSRIRTCSLDLAFAIL